MKLPEQRLACFPRVEKIHRSEAMGKGKGLVDECCKECVAPGDDGLCVLCCLFGCWCLFLAGGIWGAINWAEHAAVHATDFIVRDATLLGVTTTLECRNCCDADSAPATSTTGYDDDEPSSSDHVWKSVYHLDIDVTDAYYDDDDDEYAMTVQYGYVEYACSQTNVESTLYPCQRCVVRPVALRARRNERPRRTRAARRRPPPPPRPAK